jgi:hypothetical protein
MKAPQEDFFFVLIQYGTNYPVRDQQIRVQRRVFFILGPVDSKAGVPPTCVCSRHSGLSGAPELYPAD